MEYTVYKFDKETNGYKFMACMTLAELKKNRIDEEKRVKVGINYIQKFIIK